MIILMLTGAIIIIAMLCLSFTAVPRNWRIERKGRDARAEVVKIVYNLRPEFIVTLKDLETKKLYTERVPIPSSAVDKVLLTPRQFPRGSRWNVKVIGNEAVRMGRLD